MSSSPLYLIFSLSALFQIKPSFTFFKLNRFHLCLHGQGPLRHPLAAATLESGNGAVVAPKKPESTSYDMILPIRCCRRIRKICWPFPTVGNCNKLEEQMLPPLHVPEFRWWRCQNCLKKTDAKDAPMENMVLTNCCNIACRTKTAIPSGFTFTSSCGDAQKLLSGFQQSSEINIVDGRKSSSDVSLHMNNVENCLTLFVDGKEKGAEVEHPGTKDIDWLMVSQQENMNLASCKSTYSTKKDDTYLEGGLGRLSLVAALLLVLFKLGTKELTSKVLMSIRQPAAMAIVSRLMEKPTS